MLYTAIKLMKFFETSHSNAFALIVGGAVRDHEFNWQYRTAFAMKDVECFSAYFR